VYAKQSHSNRRVLDVGSQAAVTGKHCAHQQLSVPGLGIALLLVLVLLPVLQQQTA
jgi:hypothetical protein